MAFFGLDSSQVENVPERVSRSLICEKYQNRRVHCFFHQLRPEDVVFLKRFTPQTGLVVLAAGVVEPGFVEDEARTCIHVQWAWKGECTLSNQQIWTALAATQSMRNSIWQYSGK